MRSLPSVPEKRAEERSASVLEVSGLHKSTMLVVEWVLEEEGEKQRKLNKKARVEKKRAGK